MKKIIFLSLINIIVCYGQEKANDCVYDSTKINEDFIRKINVDKYVWNDASKEAKIISKEGDFVYIRKWACETQGLIARFFVLGDYKEVDKDFVKWRKKITSEASTILESNDFLELQEYFSNESLSAEKFGTDLIFEIKSKSRKKFVVVLSPLDKLVIINYLIYN